VDILQTDVNYVDGITALSKVAAMWSLPLV